MDLNADDILNDKKKDAPKPCNMLQENSWLHEKELGHPLNVMGDVYNETSPESSMVEEDTLD